MSPEDAAGTIRIPPHILTFTPEGIDDIVRALAPLLRPEDVHLLEPHLRPQDEPIVHALEALPWHDPNVAVEQALNILMRETNVGRVLDPTADDADVLWCHVLVRLAGHPKDGSRAARRWFAHIFRLQTDDVPVSVVHEGVAAYAVAAFEKILGRTHEAERWLHTADIVAEHDHPMMGLVAFTRAARLLGPVLGRCPPSTRP